MLQPFEGSFPGSFWETRVVLKTIPHCSVVRQKPFVGAMAAAADGDFGFVSTMGRHQIGVVYL